MLVERTQSIDCQSVSKLRKCRIGNKSEWFILGTFPELGQFGIMQFVLIISVISILTFNIDFSFGNFIKNLRKIQYHKFS